MNIILTGMKHCGKSTHGRMLAKKLGWIFFDTDKLIEEYYYKAYCSELNCREIYRKVGEKIFRKMETELIKFMLSKSKNATNNAIIALGGGLIANQEVQPLLKQLGKVVFLQVPYQILYRRIIKKGVPPFLDAQSPYESFMELCRQREIYYLNAADITVNLDNLSLNSANRLIATTIERYIK